MEFIIATICLGILAIFYILRYYMLKANLHKAARNLKEIVKDPNENRILLVTYPNKEAEDFLEVMNEYIKYARKNKVHFDRREKELRAQIENVSHDLRTPLTAIIGYLELLDTKSMSEDDQEMIHAIAKKSRALQTLIANFYDLSRLEMDDYHLQLEDLELNRFIKETMLSSYQSFEQRGLSIELALDPEDCHLNVDYGAMERIFNNMLQNALRYATSYLHVKLFKEPSANMVNLIFTNDCTGLKPEDVEHIFERFYVAEKARTKQSTGLGLTINKLLTEAMRGSVEASVIGNELSITYRFPLS